VAKLAFGSDFSDAAQARELDNHVDGRLREADQARISAMEQASTSTSSGRARVGSCSIDIRCSRTASVMAMRFSIGCGRTTPSALATASAFVIMRLTIATISGRSAIAPNVAPVSTATGFQHRLLIILVQILSQPMARSGPRTCHCRPPESSAIPLPCHDPQAAIANRGELGPACNNADIESRHAGEMAGDVAADGADVEDVDAHGLSLLGRVAKIAPPRVLLLSRRGIRETASAEVACGWQTISPAEIHLLIEPSI
jgi:hypothetical protein